MSMHTFIICAIFRNEAHILKEWIEHYLKRGIDHIYLVDDFSTDRYESILTPYRDRVTLYKNDIKTNDIGKQIMIYNKYFMPILKTSKWAALLDLDEFLYSPYETNLGRVLDKYNGYSQIIVDWLHFGSSGYIKQPKDVVKSFIMRACIDKTKPYYSYKPIIKCKDLIGFGIHNHTVKGHTVHLSHEENGQAPLLIINHYNLQSKEWYLQVKGTRGDVNNWFDHNNLKRNENMFNDFDKNEVEDRRLAEQSARLT